METFIKATLRSLLCFIFFTMAQSCEIDDDLDSIDELAINSNFFDFNQFGKTHNAYLEYVMTIENNQDPKARFMYGKTFSDPTFGSFNIDLTYEDMNKSMAFHRRRVDLILGGTYDASSENLSPEMTSFLDKLATIVKYSIDRKLTMTEFLASIAAIESKIQLEQQIEIDLKKGISNDGAAMLAITSILKYSTKYWVAIENVNNGSSGDDLPLARPGIWRALADAWGYVSAWVDNGDGSYSWYHESALVNADCVSDKVREN